MRYGIVSLFIISLMSGIAVMAAPPTLTYQGRIVGADGKALEYSSVSFEFSITSPDGTCVLYREQKNGVDMQNSKGVFDTPIGSGAISFPTTPSTTVLDVFSNSITPLPCEGGSTFAPASDDGRRLRVRFWDGIGWHLINPDAIIRTVPYAAHAAQSGNAKTFDGQGLNQFVLKGQIPVCGVGYVLTSTSAGALTCTPDTGGAAGTVNTIMGTAPIVATDNGAGAYTISATVGSTAGTLAAGNDTRIVNAIQTGATAGGDLSGSYPNPTVAKILNIGLTFSSLTTGQFLKYNGSNWVNSPVNVASEVTGTLPIANGGTGSTTALGAINALSPLTTKGDVLVHNGTNNIRLPIGVDGKVLKADSSQASGLIWGDAIATELSSITGTGIVQRNGAGSYSTVTVSAPLTYTGGVLGISGGIGDILNGGNATGATVSVGTTDAQSLILKTNNANRVTINSSGNLGIGTTNPGDKLHVLNGGLWNQSEVGPAGFYADSFHASQASVIVGRRARGTIASPTHPLLGDSIVSYLGANAVNENAYSGMNVVATENHSASAQGMGLSLYTVANGTTTTSTRMYINHNGYVGLGTSTPARILHVAGPMRINASAAPASPAAGDIYVDSGDSNKLKWYNGAGWQSVGTSTSTGDILNGGNGTGATVSVGTTDAQSFALKTNNTNRITILSDGKVGIGTSSPTTGLEIAGSALLSGGMTLGGPLNGNKTLLNNQSATAPGYSFIYSSDTGLFEAGGAGGHALGVSTAGAERIRVASTGEVGIGTTTPARLLHVAGPMRLTASVAPATPAAGDIYVDSGDTNKLKWYDGSSWLSVATSSGSTGALLNGGNSTGSTITAGTGDAQSFALKTNGSNRVTILSGGNVGVGTATPSTPLDVSGVVTSTGLTVNNGTNNIPANVVRGTSSDVAQFGFKTGSTISAAVPVWSVGLRPSDAGFKITSYDGTTYSDRVQVDTAGNVGIGATPSGAKLDVRGTIRSVSSTGSVTVNNTATIDWSTGNNQSMSTACTTTTFTNLPDGATVNLLVSDTSATTCVFSQAGLTFLFTPANGSRILGQQTIYSFTRFGSSVVVAWSVLN